VALGSASVCVVDPHGDQCEPVHVIAAYCWSCFAGLNGLRLRHARAMLTFAILRAAD
jgi:hypothetical protein